MKTIFLGCCFLFSTCPAWSQKLTIRTNFYNIGGTSTPELMASMVRSRPWRDTSGDHARVTWNIRWNFQTQWTGSSFAVKDFATQMTINTFLPRWTNQTSAPLALQQNWSRYLKGLLEHENGHQQTALAAAAAIRQAGSGFPAQSDSATLTRLVNERCQAILREHRLREAAYDKATRHGVAQGAHFP